MKLARPVPSAPHSDSGGPLFDLSERVTGKAALAVLHGLHDRLRTRRHDVQHRTRQDYLLMDRVAVVRRFGWPDYISESHNGASEQWSYRLGDESVEITICGDYVISIYRAESIREDPVEMVGEVLAGLGDDRRGAAGAGLG